VGAAEHLDLGFQVPHRGTERGEQRLGAAARERPAHEGAQVLPSRDGGGELREVRLGRGAGGRSAPGAALFSSLPIHRSALSVSLPNCVDCKLCWLPASISRAALGSRSISRRWLDFLPRTRSPARLPCFSPGPHVWRPPHPIGRPGDAYGRLDDAFGARRTPYAVDQGEADAQVANRALSPRRRLSDALRTELLTKLYCLFRHTYDAVCCVYLLYFLHCWCIWFKECTAYLMSFFKSLIYEG